MCISQCVCYFPTFEVVNSFAIGRLAVFCLLPLMTKFCFISGTGHECVEEAVTLSVMGRYMSV